MVRFTSVLTNTSTHFLYVEVDISWPESRTVGIKIPISRSGGQETIVLANY